MTIAKQTGCTVFASVIDVVGKQDWNGQNDKNTALENR